MLKNNLKVIIVAGARPNFIKIASLLKEFKNYKKFQPILIHTGQHYDYKMSDLFFKELNIKKPDYNLGVGSGTHAYQTAKIMEKFEPIVLKEKPKLIIVVGDVNSTLAASLVASKLNISLAHIEAGLRSFDRNMPEEINRLLTDQLADYLFITELSAIKNLLNEGISRKKIFFVGNIMIDSIQNNKNKIKSKKDILKQYGLISKKYAVLTLHRPSNVDNGKLLKKLFDIFKIISKKITIVFPIHPRTKKQISKILNKNYNFNIKIIEPLGYLEMLFLILNSLFVMTDSGGIQEETTFLGIPCLTLRKNTERPITVDIGTNEIVGSNKQKILKSISKILKGKWKKGKIPKYWDGKTAKRIVKILIRNLK